MTPAHGGGAGGGATGRGALVVGIGSPDRADDAVGPAVVGLLAERRAIEALGGRGRRAPIPADARFLVLHDPMRLVDEMSSCDLLVLVDAVVAEGSGPEVGEPGSLAVFETGPGEAALPAVAGPRAAGTHGMGLAEAVELGRALGRLPARVVVVGVVAGEVAQGARMSAAASAAIPLAARRVLDLLAASPGDDEPDPTAPPPWLPHPTGAPEPPAP